MDNKNKMKEVLPKKGLLYQEDIPTTVLCKPKLMPMKSITLEKMEQMQKDAQETIKMQDEFEREQEAIEMRRQQEEIDMMNRHHQSESNSAETLTL